MRLLPSPNRRLRNRVGMFLRVAAMGSIAAFPVFAYAGGSDQAANTDEIARLEQRAIRANPREQVYLYTELIHSWTEQAARELADGDSVQAKATLEQINHYVGLIHRNLAHDAKRLKVAQELIHNTTYRLTSVLHLVSEDDRAAVVETLKQLDQVNVELLAQVFTH